MTDDRSSSKTGTLDRVLHTHDVIDPDFYLRGAVEVARGLLGAVLVHETPHGVTSGRIVETEAYAGVEDAACHSYRHAERRPGHRTNAMYDEGGLAYVYLIYGMYHCFNVVANIPGKPEAALIRALEPLEGIELMKRRRKTEDTRRLCSGPGKLCQAMGITLEQYGTDLKTRGGLYLLSGEPPDAAFVLATPRMNVDYSGEAKNHPYRFVDRGSEFLSSRRFIPKR